MTWAPDSLRSGGYDEYGYDWALGAGITGTLRHLGRTAGAHPAHVPLTEWAADPAYSWERDGAVATLLNTADLTSAAMLETILPELAPSIEGLGGSAAGGPCLHPLSAVLCEGDALMVECEAKAIGLIEQILPTRLELATLALDEAGIALALTNGPGLHGIYEPIPRDYTTEGKSVSEVVRDMLFEPNPRHWFAPGVLFVDGRALPAATIDAPPASLVASVDLWRDEAVHAASVTVDTSAAPVPPTAPDLADFLADCNPGAVDECEGRTFETMQEGTLAWTETAGAGHDYIEVDILIEKKHGQIVRETRTKRGWRITAAGGGFTQRTFGVVEVHEKQHAYLACCPEALAHTLETVHVAKQYDQAPGFDEDTSTPSEEAIRWWNLMPAWYLHSRREITQTWHAEGWLRFRNEVGKVFDGFEFGEVTLVGGGVSSFVRATYNDSGRTESFAPIGGGLWHVNTVITETVLTPMREVVDGRNEIVGATRGTATNSYTVVTDGGPPTVSCQSDPCLDGTCEENATARYAAALAEHQRTLGAQAASVVNAPARRLVQSLTINRPVAPRVGDVIATTRGSAILSRVAWSGAGARAERPGDSVQVEAWSAL